MPKPCVIIHKKNIIPILKTDLDQLILEETKPLLLKAYKNILLLSPKLEGLHTLAKQLNVNLQPNSLITESVLLSTAPTAAPSVSIIEKNAILPAKPNI